MKERFYIIIAKFCDSLADFVQTLSHSTRMSGVLIKGKKKRTHSFDTYVLTIENFNDLNYEVILFIKEIILSLNNLFINNSLPKLIDFLERLRGLLLLLLEKNVFENLNIFKSKLDKKYDKDINMIERISKIKYLIFRLFTTTIDITTIFIPQLSLVKNIIVELEKTTNDNNDMQLNKLNESYFNLDDVIKQLYNLELKSQIILSIDVDSIFDCLYNKDAKKLIITMKKLEDEYIEMMQLALYLKSEIQMYTLKPKSVYAIIQKKLQKKFKT
jgi:hypothetical protein